MSLHPRAVVVRRRTEYDELVARHGTRQHAEFFLQSRGRDFSEVVTRHADTAAALEAVAGAVPEDWRRAEIERDDLHRFVFDPEDVIVVVGQDGLVANVAKYLEHQPVVGIDPEPGRNAGVLVTHPPSAAAGLMAASVSNDLSTTDLTMVEVLTDDHQSLRALNEVYIGQAGHQSSKYRIELPDGRSEHQSSSGVLVGTGTGGTGWLLSVSLERRTTVQLPTPPEPALCWFVREAWPSPVTGANLTQGSVSESEHLTVVVESDQLVCFGDGIERDSLVAKWGQTLAIRVAPTSLRLVT